MADQKLIDFREKLLQTLVDAQDLRFASELQPRAEDGPADLHDRLLRARANLDRLEYVLVQTSMSMSLLRGRVREAREAQEDAWAEASQKKRMPEFSSAKERDAAYSLASFETKVALRRAEAMLAEAEFAVDTLRVLYRGLDGLRRDMETLLRAKSLATALER